MQKWEYQAIATKGKRIQAWTSIRYEWEPIPDLNEMGEEGWELVAVVPIAGFDQGNIITIELKYFFKRQK
jgi:hypothetical protein